MDAETKHIVGIVNPSVCNSPKGVLDRTLDLGTASTNPFAVRGLYVYFLPSTVEGPDTLQKRVNTPNYCPVSKDTSGDYVVTVP